MWKIYQDKTVSNDGYGNCKAACVASILELRLQDLPDINPNICDFHNAWSKTLADLGYKEADTVCVDDDDDPPPKGYSIMSVVTERVYPEGHSKAGRNIAHAMVAYDGKLVHDPFPGGSKILRVICYTKLLPLTSSERQIHLLKNSV